jgi:DNA-binding PadR family transcriptional regulator
MDHRDLLSGFIRLHILHHAAEGELYGLWMIEELGRQGYRMSPGTLYPLLHGLEKKGAWFHAWSVRGAQPESIIGQPLSAARQSNWPW